MVEGLGTPQAIGTYWLIIGISLLGAVLIYGTLLIPLLGVAYYLDPTAFEYSIYAIMGFLVLYSIDSVSIMHEIEDLEEFVDWFFELLKSMGRTTQLTVLLLVLVYLYGIVTIGVIGGVVLDNQLGLPAVGLIIALIFPGWDLHTASYTDRTSLGESLLTAILRIFQFFGILRDITASSVIERASPT